MTYVLSRSGAVREPPASQGPGGLPWRCVDHHVMPVLGVVDHDEHAPVSIGEATLVDRLDRGPLLEAPCRTTHPSSVGATDRRDADDIAGTKVRADIAHPCIVARDDIGRRTASGRMGSASWPLAPRDRSVRVGEACR